MLDKMFTSLKTAVTLLISTAAPETPKVLRALSDKGFVANDDNIKLYNCVQLVI